MEPQEKITISQWELEKEREHAVIKEKLTVLEDIIPKIHRNMQSLDKKVGDIPLEIVTCRDSMEKAIKEYVHSEFVTTLDLQNFETKLERKISSDISALRVDLVSVRNMVWKATWILSGFISAGIFIFYMLSNTNIKIM